MFKRLLYFTFFISAIALFAKNPSSQVQVIVNRGQSLAVIVSTSSLSSIISANAASQLIGSNSNAYYVGQLSVYIFNNTPEVPHTLSLTSSTFNTGLNQYVAINGSAFLPVGIKKNFDTLGNRTAFNYIAPSLTAVTIRSSLSTIDETRTFFFYILENSANIFIDGNYRASFTLSFSSL